PLPPPGGARRPGAAGDRDPQPARRLLPPPRPRAGGPQAGGRGAPLLGNGRAVTASVHPSAIVDPSARLADGVVVGPLAVIGAGGEIRAGASGRGAGPIPG